MFDEVIGCSCGLRVDEAVPWPELPEAQLPLVSTTDCYLDSIESRTVDGHQVERIGP
jgi:hypothetical protein